MRKVEQKRLRKGKNHPESLVRFLKNIKIPEKGGTSRADRRI